MFHSECESQQLDRLLDSSKPAGGFDWAMDPLLR